MSNNQISGGLRLYKAISGAGQQLEMVHMRAGDSTATFIGDAVQIDSTAGAGSVGMGPIAIDVKQSAAGGAVYGVVQGFLPQFLDGTAPMNFTQMYRSASTAAYAVVRRANPDDIYCIMDDGNVASGVPSSLGLINVGYNANLAVAAGNTSTGMSNMKLGGASIATTATLQLKMLGVVNDALNDPTATFARWTVAINNCQSNTGGTGVLGV